MTAELRVYGQHLDLDRCLAWLPADRLDKVWRVGERLRGRASTDSGFNVLLSDAKDPEQLVREAVTRFAAVAENVAELVRAGATAEIDFALYVGPHTPRSIVFEPETLRTIQQYGVAVEVSAYPCAEDEDDET